MGAGEKARTHHHIELPAVRHLCCRLEAGNSFVLPDRTEDFFEGVILRIGFDPNAKDLVEAVPEHGRGGHFLSSPAGPYDLAGGIDNENAPCRLVKDRTRKPLG